MGNPRMFDELSATEKEALDRIFVIPSNTSNLEVRANGQPLINKGDHYMGLEVKKESLVCGGFHSYSSN